MFKMCNVKGYDDVKKNDYFFKNALAVSMAIHNGNGDEISGAEWFDLRVFLL